MEAPEKDPDVRVWLYRGAWYAMFSPVAYDLWVNNITPGSIHPDSLDPIPDLWGWITLKVDKAEKLVNDLQAIGLEVVGYYPGAVQTRNPQARNMLVARRRRR